MRIIGISAYYHDSAAVLLENGIISAAAQEERFTRLKHDPGFPEHALDFCLKKQGIRLEDVDYICFYDKPLIKFERLLETYFSYAPKGLRSFLSSMPVWLKEKLLLKRTLKRELEKFLPRNLKQAPRLLFTEHHQAHAASAFFASPFQQAAVLCLDGVGEWATTSVWQGKNNQLVPLWEIHFPHSLGLLYSAFTYYTGFRVNSGEYKLMGLAPYGNPRYVDRIYENLIHVKSDGSFRLNMAYFNYAAGLTMTSSKFHHLFGGPPRQPESALTQKEMDLAKSIQIVTEQVIFKIAETVKQKTGEQNLCLAGGVALNCVANGKIAKQGLFKDIWIQPAAGDAGGAIGAALSVWHEYLGNPQKDNGKDLMKGTYLGPCFSNDEIKTVLESNGAVYQRLDDAQLLPMLASLIADGHVIGWFQGPMEFGPRALGSRSILADPRSKKMQTTLNLKIKYRESFRPFAPSVKEDKAGDWFELDRASPYMLLVADVKKEKQVPLEIFEQDKFGIDKLNVIRSLIPAITHVDFSARVQTVDQTTNPRYWMLLDSFEKETGCPVLINTSFNVRGEPIVCTPMEAYQCFMGTEMDYLVLENHLLSKTDQPCRSEDWKKEFKPD